LNENEEKWYWESIYEYQRCSLETNLGVQETESTHYNFEKDNGMEIECKQDKMNRSMIEPLQKKQHTHITFNDSGEEMKPKLEKQVEHEIQNLEIQPESDVVQRKPRHRKRKAQNITIN
jgi:hypothetical protein